MKILLHRSFDNHYRKLLPAQKVKFKTRIALFSEDPFDPILRNHALVGKYRGYRSIDIGGDLRAVYKNVNETVCLFIAIGTHAKLYSK